jgi:hypothetical protein
MLNRLFDNQDDYNNQRPETFEDILDGFDHLVKQTHISLVNSIVREVKAIHDPLGTQGLKVSADTLDYLYNSPELDGFDIRMTVSLEFSGEDISKASRVKEIFHGGSND